MKESQSTVKNFSPFLPLKEKCKENKASKET